MRGLCVAVLAIAGCGRYGFSSHDGGVDDARIDARSIDAPRATPALVQMTTQNASATPTTVAFNIGSGHLVVVAALSGSTQIMSIEDGTPGNTYVSAQTREVSAASEMVDIWYAANTRAITGGVTITLSSDFGGELWLAEFAGVQTASPLATTARNTGTTSGTAVGASVATTTPDELVFSMLGLGSGIGLSAISAGNPFTSLSFIEGDDCAFDVPAQPGIYAPAWALNGSNSFVTSSVAFLPGTL
jgi:hypothetical protein